MPSIQEISFYHECGHTENRIYSNLKSRNQFKLRLPSEIPIIDWEVFTTGTLEENYTDETLEVHYRTKTKCPSCRTNRNRHKLKNLSEQLKQERRLMWSDYARTFKFQWRYTAAVEFELMQEMSRLDKVIEWEAKHQCHIVNTTESEKQQVLEQYRQVHFKRQLYTLFDTAHHLQSRMPEFDDTNVHLLAPGYDTKILVPAPEPKIEDRDDKCSICLQALYNKDGRQRSLPCGHTWHHGCIFEWLKQDNSCPMCRKKYRIMAMPDMDDQEATQEFREIIMNQLSDLNSLTIALDDDFDDDFDDNWESDGQGDEPIDQEMEQIQEMTEGLEMDGFTIHSFSIGDRRRLFNNLW